MTYEPNSHNHYHQPGDMEADTSLPPELEVLAGRLAVDGALWQSRLPDPERVAERIRAIPHESPVFTSSGERGLMFEDTGSASQSNRAVLPNRSRPNSFLQRLGSLAAVAVVLILVGSMALVFYAVHTNGKGSRAVTSATSTASTIPATATPFHPSGPVVTSRISGITMFSATTGWGSVPISNPNIVSGIALTDDGGHTWYNVTPNGLTQESSFTIALYPRSATEAWTWLSTLDGGSSTTLWHTTDGGAHWSTSAVPTGAVRQLDFSDSQHGWLTATPNGAAAGEYPINVWRTTDGGATWSQVASYPVFGSTLGLSFANATTGFANGCPLGGSSGSPLGLCVTQNGGSSWSPVSSLTPPISVQGGLPVFTTATTGVLEVSHLSLPSGPVTLYLYRTTDGGANWQLGPTLSGTSNTSVPANSFPSSVLSSGEVVAAPTVNGQVTLYQLPLGATGWTKVTTGTSSVALLGGLTQLDFVSPTIGWAVTSSGLIETSDGGGTWTVLHA
jgi:photosystem II stability/assembly factor-like uncharacterized protein